MAVSDGSLVTEDDLLATDHVTRHYVGETYNLMYRNKYRWYYISHQQPDEVLMFKTYDSDTDIPARRKIPNRLPHVGILAHVLIFYATDCPHASFRHGHVLEGSLPRESIEVRALIFSDD